MSIMHQLRRVLPLLRFASSIVEKIPERRDTPLQVITKILAIIGEAHKQWMDDVNPVRDVILAPYEERNSKPFVTLFFSSAMSRGYAIRRHRLSDRSDLIEAKDSRGGSIFFKETNWGSGEVVHSGEFYVTKDFNVARAMDDLWRGPYRNGVYVTVKTTGYWRDIAFVPMGASPRSATTEKAKDLLTQTVDVHKASGGRRSYLLHGPPGTGKSGFALDFAAAVGGRLLKIDPSALPHLSVDDIGFLLDALCPDVLVLDDFDRTPSSDGIGARLLFLVEHLRSTRPATTILVTVNDPKKLDPALLRSERLDIPIAFTCPDDDERRELVDAVLSSILLVISSEDHGRIVAATAGFPHSDVAAVVRRLQYEQLSEVLASVSALRALSSDAESTTTPKPS